jgi:hypothetical protein
MNQIGYEITKEIRELWPMGWFLGTCRMQMGAMWRTPRSRRRQVRGDGAAARGQCPVRRRRRRRRGHPTQPVLRRGGREGSIPMRVD